MRSFSPSCDTPSPSPVLGAVVEGQVDGCAGEDPLGERLGLADVDLAGEQFALERVGDNRLRLGDDVSFVAVFLRRRLG